MRKIDAAVALSGSRLSDAAVVLPSPPRSVPAMQLSLCGGRCPS